MQVGLRRFGGLKNRGFRLNIIISNRAQPTYDVLVFMGVHDKLNKDRFRWGFKDGRFRMRDF